MRFESADGHWYELRLRRLEAENRVLKVLGAACLLLSVCLLVVACSNDRQAIRAQRFVLVDAHGKTMGGLVAGSEGPALELYDGNGILRVVISLAGGMPNLTLKDASGTGRLVLGIVPTGPGLILADEQGALRARLDVGHEGPRLYVEDEKGFSTTVGSYYTADPKANAKLTAASLVLSHQRLGVIWHVP